MGESPVRMARGEPITCGPRWSSASILLGYLSTTLPALILSMTMTCLLRWLVDVSVMPSVAPGDLAISTSSGPDAFVTVSGGEESQRRWWIQ